MWRTLRAGCAALALLGPAAEAADSQGRANIHGLGRAPCKRFVELCEKGATECRLTASWVDGYISALNATTPETFDLFSWQDSSVVGEFAFNICKQNPDAVLVEAINEVVRQALVPGRVRTASDRVRIGEGKDAVLLYRETVRAMQQRLVDAGHLKGGVDGAFGPGTKAAVESFQRAAGLQATGVPDQRTLATLFYGTPRPQASDGAGQQQRRPQQQQQERPRAPAASAVPRGVGAGAGAPPLDLNLAPPARSP